MSVWGWGEQGEAKCRAGASTLVSRHLSRGAVRSPLGFHAFQCAVRVSISWWDLGLVAGCLRCLPAPLEQGKLLGKLVPIAGKW